MLKAPRFISYGSVGMEALDGGIEEAAARRWTRGGVFASRGAGSTWPAARRHDGDGSLVSGEREDITRACVTKGKRRMITCNNIVYAWPDGV